MCRRRGRGGGVGFEEEAVQGDLAKDFAATGVAGTEEGAVEREIRAEAEELREHFRRAAVGVEEEAALGEGRGFEDVQERAEGVEAVDAGGEIAFGGEGELRAEDFDLCGERGAAESGEARVVGAGAVEYPAVEADFSDGRAGVGVERGAERVEPGGGAVAGVPGVEAVAGVDKGVAAGERGDVGPVGFAGAVDHGAAQADFGAGSRYLVEVRGERGVLEVIVGIEKQF